MPADLDLLAFVRENIHSIWALELLLLLRFDRDRWWTVSDIVRELRATNHLVNMNLTFFQRRALAIQDAGRWRYGANEAIDQKIQALAQAYRERPSSTIQMIFRDDPVQSLADAFKLKGQEK